MTGLISVDDFLAYSRDNLLSVRKLCRSFEQIVEGQDYSFVCSVCNRIRKSYPFSPGENLRNTVGCTCCGFTGRQRHLFDILQQQAELFQCKPSLAVFESITAFAHLIRLHFPGALHSEFVDTCCDMPGGSLATIKHSGEVVRHEDIMNTSYQDEFFDLVVHADVWEHIASIEAAANEARRILRPKGKMVFTMPLYDHMNATIVNAKYENGRFEWLGNPAYHGNPVDPENGAPVYSFAGSDFFDVLYSHGFDVKLSLGLDFCKGYFPDCCPVDMFHSWNLVFVATKI